MIKLEKKVWLYIALVFIFSYVFQLIGILNGGKDFNLFQVFIGLQMFFPAVGAIIYLIKTKQGLKFINWRIGNPKYILISLIGPIVLTLLGILLVEKIGLGINYAYSIENGIVSNIDIPLFLGSEDQSITFFILNFIVTGIGFSLVTSLFTVGEEIGWRGFLQKKLLEQNGIFKSMLFLGLLWGFWHFPIMVNGFNYPEHPILGAFLIFPITALGVTFFLGWLTVNSKSIWPAVFAHASINAVMIYLFEMDFGSNTIKANFLIAFLWIMIGLISYRLISKPKKEKNELIHKTESNYL